MLAALLPLGRTETLAVAAAAMGAEMLLFGIVLHRPYPWSQSVASFWVAVGHLGTRLVSRGLFAGIYAWAWQYRFMTTPLDSAWAWLTLFLAVEFLYYWHHRLSHGVRFLWAHHAVHHSAEELVLIAAYRLGWTEPLSGAWLFWLPLVFLGFPPAAVLGLISFNLFYQFWLHTTLIPKLGPLEWVLNTPSHHRVHHSSEPQHLDRNFGGVLIVFDRLFGTYICEQAQPRRYGLVDTELDTNPFHIVFRHWITLVQELLRVRSPRAALAAIFGRPNGIGR